MKRTIAILGTMILLALPGIVLASTWNVDPDHSNIGFKVRHLMVSNVKGSFAKYVATVELNDQDITQSKVTATIDTSSIDTNVQKRDEDLRSANFFDVDKYPTMTFTSKKVVKTGDDHFTVTGDLTLHGVTREVVLDVEGMSRESKDPWGNIRRGATATAKINRKDFGLAWNAVLETGGVVVGEEVAILLEVELIKVQAK
ncbi:MAG: YceI family protein [Desulfuromonadales bacterium]|nr:YceI family protein [Desulfuromonadales bacterium]